MQDTIERSITINAPLERVWDLVTEPGWWVPNDAAVASGTVARSPGTVVVRDSAQHGRFPVEVVELRPMTYAAFRWASTFPGEELAPGKTTLIEFSVAPTDAGVTVSVLESGFATLETSDEAKQGGFDSNADGWPEVLGELRTRAEG